MMKKSTKMHHQKRKKATAPRDSHVVTNRSTTRPPYMVFSGTYGCSCPIESGNFIQTFTKNCGNLNLTCNLTALCGEMLGVIPRMT